MKFKIINNIVLATTHINGVRFESTGTWEFVWQEFSIFFYLSKGV